MTRTVAARSVPPRPVSKVQTLWEDLSTGGRQLVGFGYSIWLFTRSDIKTILAPSVCFGVLNMYSATSFELKSELAFLECLRRAPLMMFWVWLNLLPFNIDNQRKPIAIAEDNINKPWRTLPSKRMSPQQAETVMYITYACALFASTRIGGIRQCLALICLGFWYNRGKGADCGFLIRNLINGGGFLSFLSGAVEVGYGPAAINTRMVQWLVIIGAVVFTTVQLQDMYDQAGDAARSRKTLPLVIGDVPARWVIAIMMVIWGVFCPYFWGGGILSSNPSRSGILVSVLAFVISLRSLSLHSVADDKKTFLLWNFWMVMLYTLPLSRASRSSTM